MRRIVFYVAGVVCAILAQAQIGYFNDALLFSRTDFGGSARIQALGGAQVALGGDVSVAASNPAGLGFFNRSVFTISPSLNFHNANSSYLGEETNSLKGNFNFNQLGVVLNYTKGDIVKDKFKGGSFAISLNRINDFHGEILYEGRNNQSSILDSFIENAGNLPPDDLPALAFTAYDHYLIGPSETYDFVNRQGGGVNIIPQGAGQGYSSPVGSFPFQRERITTTGAQYRLNLAYGANYDDKIYFGGGLGIQTVDYTRFRTYTESQFQFEDGTRDELLQGIRIEDELTITGSGVNANFGLTVRPVNFVTVGVSYTTPTYYALSDLVEEEFVTEWGNDVYFVENNSPQLLGTLVFESDQFITDYTLRTPGRLNVGLATFISKYGFLTGDVEIVDYTGANVRSNDFDEAGDNRTIEDLYTNAINYRLGAEGRIGKFRVRGGYSLQADPYEEPGGLDRSRTNITGGVGYRERDFFIDLAVINSRFNQYKNPYTTGFDSPLATVERSTFNSVVTLGFVF